MFIKLTEVGSNVKHVINIDNILFLKSVEVANDGYTEILFLNGWILHVVELQREIMADIEKIIEKNKRPN